MSICLNHSTPLCKGEKENKGLMGNLKAKGLRFLTVRTMLIQSNYYCSLHFHAEIITFYITICIFL